MHNKKKQLIESGIAKIVKKVLRSRGKMRIMETTSKFIPLEDAIKIIDDLDEREMVEQTYDEYSGSSFHRSICFLDLKTGKIFYRQMGNNESFQDFDRYFGIYSIDQQTIANISDRDIAGDDEIPDDGVEDFDDYDDRVLEVLKWYASQYKFKENIMDRLKEWYDGLPMMESSLPFSFDRSGAVAVSQALSHHFGLSDAVVAKLMGTSKRTIFNYRHARSGSNVTPWNNRTPEQKSAAIKKAQSVLKSKGQ